MRVNIYAEEMTDRVELIEKVIDGHAFTAVRFYLELPATVGGKQYAGPFIHRPGDDDSSAVTFWGKRDMRPLLKKALAVLDVHYGDAPVGKDEGSVTVPTTEAHAFVRCMDCRFNPACHFNMPDHHYCGKPESDPIHTAPPTPTADPEPSDRDGAD